VRGSFAVPRAMTASSNGRTARVRPQRRPRRRLVVATILALFIAGMSSAAVWYIFQPVVQLTEADSVGAEPPFVPEEVNQPIPPSTHTAVPAGVGPVVNSAPAAGSPGPAGPAGPVGPVGSVGSVGSVAENQPHDPPASPGGHLDGNSSHFGSGNSSHLDATPPPLPPVGPSPPPSPEPNVGMSSSTHPAPPDLDTFVNNCEHAVHEWRKGNVNYPTQFEVDPDESFTYQAVVDVGNTPLAPEVALPGQPSPQSKPVAVKCNVAARLIAVDSKLVVSGSEWVPRSFTPTGMADWSWTVKAARGGKSQLRLEIEPAISLLNGVLQVSQDDPQISSFVTNVAISQSSPQPVAGWVIENRAALGTIFMALVGAISCTLRSWKKAHKEVRSSRSLPNEQTAMKIEPKPTDETDIYCTLVSPLPVSRSRPE
jgi:hypothetical protein